MSEQNPENREDRTDSGGNKPSDANRELNEFRPFRYFQRRIRLAQRKDAKNDERKRYRDTPESATAKLLHYADLTWKWAWSRGPAVWTAFFSGVLTAATIAGWWAMRDQNNLMRDQFIQTESESRAVITSVLPTIAELKIGEPIRCRVNLSNAGHRRAIMNFLEGKVDILPKGMSPRILLDGIRQNIGKLGARRNLVEPTQQVSYRHPPTVPLTEAHKKLIDSGFATLYFAVVTQYTDGYKGTKTVGFCFFYDLDSKELFSDAECGYVDEWTDDGNHKK